MIPPSGAREDSGDGLTGEATGTEQPPSPASTSSLESKVWYVRLPACPGETQSPLSLCHLSSGVPCQGSWDQQDPLLLMLKLC